MSLLTLALMVPGPPASAQADSYKVIHDFAGTPGSFPVGNLVADEAGNLYGVLTGDINTAGNCVSGSNCGSVFKLSKTASGGWVSIQLHQFTGEGTDGASPQGGLVLDAAGNLYGTTYAGGSYGLGTAFELSPTSGGGWTYAVIYNFGVFYDGHSPQAALILDSSGNLYGTTLTAGSDGNCVDSCGVVFELSPSASGVWTENVIYYFGGDNGSWPSAPLVFDAAGNLYGTTQYGGKLKDCASLGCGVVFKVSPDSLGYWSGSVLYSFAGGSDGALPFYSGVILDAAGNLYGTTTAGGNAGCKGGCGVVYELSPESNGSWTETAIHRFTAVSGTPSYGGGWPESGLTPDTSGNLYGATYLGGKGEGVVFKVSPNSSGGWNETVLHAFTGGTAGGYPYQSGLMFGPDGYLYGTTLSGGDLSQCGGEGCGVVFRITP
jgi:uncharacterized repeat protein (TIGR03803 family)